MFAATLRTRGELHVSNRPAAFCLLDSKAFASPAALLAGASALALLSASPVMAGDILRGSNATSPVAYATAAQAAAMQAAQEAARQAQSSLTRVTQAIQAMQSAQTAAPN